MGTRSFLVLTACAASFAACVVATDQDVGERTAETAQAVTQVLVPEGEPNAAIAQATPLGLFPVTAEGNVFPTGDVDYYSFTAAAGDRIYAATMTAFSSSGTVDTSLDLIASDGVSVIETDLDDGTYGATASGLSGVLIPAAGTYYLRVTGVAQIRPYQLHAMVKSGAPFAEFEPNDTLLNAQPLAPGRWMSGALGTTADNDYYTFPLNAGDTVYGSLDLDPERDGDWNGQLIFGVVNGSSFGTNDLGGLAGPDSESFFYTVKNAGNYYFRVAAGVAGAFGTYQLAVSVTPLPSQAACTTYSSADAPQVIPAAGGKITSTLTVPAGTRIGSMTMALALDHTAMPDVDVHLQSPAGNDNALFTDVGAASATVMDLVLSDSAALPITAFSIMNVGMLQPKLNYRMHWFDGEDAGGTWTLNVEDDTSNVNGGNLNAWSITICPPAPQVACPAGAYSVNVLAADFENAAGGFTHSGTLDQWALGTPAGSVIASCASGTKCFKTNLAGNYANSTSSDLLSPTVSLTGLVAPIRLRWAQKYQMESATNDHASVDLVPSVGSPKRVWEFLDATMTAPVGLAPTTIQESAGWGIVETNLDSYAGQTLQVKYHMDSDAAGAYAGYAVDDVKVTACKLNTCGDGVAFGGEVCDDGNAVNGDGCDSNCTVTACGNNVVSPGEACDDGNTVSGDGCDSNCKVTACGNGVVTMGEICDDGNLVDGDGCDSNCTATACGNNVVSAGEICDDGNVMSGDGCDANCTLTACGNGVVTMGEACDDGNLVDGDGCDSNCTISGCGNGVLNAGEICDDGNKVDGDGCDSNCTATACGNGVMTTGEACDDGNAIDGDGCDSNCTATACGNTIVTSGEACDDGNLIDGDGCDSNCKATACGNGVVTAGEICDDGNKVDGDGCDSNCTATACGNSVVTAGETCDDGNKVDGDGCDSNCTATACGNGIVTAGEECDDGNTVSGDGCDASCKKEGMGTGAGGGTSSSTASASSSSSSGTGAGGAMGTGGSESTSSASSTSTGGDGTGVTGGCGCSVPGSTPTELPPGTPVIALAALALVRRRRASVARG
jgi:MYXO-CTERM domain-containing protein